MNLDIVGMSLLHSIFSAVIILGLMFVMKITVDKIVSKHYNSDQEIRNGNLAVTLRRCGLYLGTAIAMYSIIGDWYMQLIDGATIIVFMLVAMYISEVIIFPNFDNIEALKNRNLAIGFSEAGLFIGTGIIATASFSGSGPWVSSIVFFILGQVILLAGVYFNEFVHKGTISEIEKGNTSAGIMLGGITIAYALILKGAIAGPFTGWLIDIQAFFISAIMGGLLIFLLASKVIERIFFSGNSIGKEVLANNYSVVSVVVAIKISIALIISGVVL